MEVTETGAEIEYDCAHGRITERIVPDRSGNFEVKGVHVTEHGGPVRIDEKPNEQPARYSGWTDGRRMTLTVTVEGRKEAIGTFNLGHGSPGRVFKCR